MKKLITIINLFFVLSGFTQSDINLSAVASVDWEPYIAVNPNDSNNIIAAWMRLKLSDFKIAIAYRSSHDGGSTWSTMNYMPHFGTSFSSADVSIAFNKNGDAFMSYVEYKQQTKDSGIVYVAKSTNGGATWNAPVQAIAMTESPDLPVDRPWIAIDNSGGVTDGTIYLSSMSAYWYTGTHHAWIKKSTDGGNTWSNLRQVDSLPYTITGLSPYTIKVGTDGKLYGAYISYNPSSSPFARFISAVSDDTLHTIKRHVIANYFPTLDTNYQNSHIIAVAKNKKDTAVLCWLDTRFGDADIVASQTIDGGITWSTPVRVNKDALANGIGQDMVWADFSETGALGIAWRDRRNGSTSSQSTFDLYGCFSNDGGTTFVNERKLNSATSAFNYVNRGNDFIGVAMTDTCMHTIWADYRSSSDWDVYYNKNCFSFSSVPEIISENNIDIKIFPNPSAGNFFIAITVNQHQQDISIDLVDIAGKVCKKIYAGDLMFKQPYTFSFNANEFPAGTYQVIVKDKSGIISAKKILTIRE